LSHPKPDKTCEPFLVAFSCHFAFWFGLVFATPVFVASHNREDLVFGVGTFSIWAALTALVISLSTWKLADLLRAPAAGWFARILLAAAIVIAIQGNMVHGLFDYGAFNGERVDYRAYGWAFWLEAIAWLAAFPLGVWLLARMSKLPGWLAALPIASFLLLLAPVLSRSDTAGNVVAEDDIDASVFDFSRVGNLVHLLADGLQADVVRQVFEENPDLAGHFEGFTLYTDNVGTNQGTAPAMYTMLTGKSFDLKTGFDYRAVIPDIEKNSYQAELAKAGYRIDYVPISGFICLKSADSCVVRPFNDMKSRGFYRHRGEDTQYSIRLIADLSLFRIVPMYLKEKIHNDGEWFFADTTLDGSSPYPDPVIREWSQQMQVVDDRPVYKWHHFIGTHVPAKWNAQCQLLEEAAKDRPAYVEQAHCVLRGIAGLLDALESNGIYDQTAMILSGDHGHNVASDDATGDWFNTALTPGLHGTGRPALLVKRRNLRHPLAFSDQPSSIMDIKATALALSDQAASSPPVFQLQDDAPRERLFRVYSTAVFYSGNPVPYTEYSVGQPANDRSVWAISDMFMTEPVPAQYDPLNRPNGKGFVHGARLRKSMGNNQSSWVTGRQLAFVIAAPEPAHQALEISLHVPEWMGRQHVTVRIDGARPWRSGPLEFGKDFWQAVRIPLPGESRMPGYHFVSMVFDKLLQPPDVDNWKAAALVQSIRTVEQSNGDQPVATHQ
jgi:hypothetical protein